MTAFREFRERARGLKSLPEEGAALPGFCFLIYSTADRRSALARPAHLTARATALDLFLREHPSATNVLASFLEELPKVDPVGGVRESAIVRK